MLFVRKSKKKKKKCRERTIAWVIFDIAAHTSAKKKTENEIVTDE